MTKASLFEIFRVLNATGSRYLVVGGIAVNAHGYPRMTKDVDLMIQLDETNLLNALRALAQLGYRPSIPVTFEQFADPTNREAWVSEKEMKVLRLWSDVHRETDIDVFVYAPIAFDEAYTRIHLEALERSTAPQGTPPFSEKVQLPVADNPNVVIVPVCSYSDLVKLKLLSSRPQDLADIDQLRVYRGES